MQAPFCHSVKDDRELTSDACLLDPLVAPSSEMRSSWTQYRNMEVEAGRHVQPARVDLGDLRQQVCSRVPVLGDEGSEIAKEIAVADVG